MGNLDDLEIIAQASKEEIEEKAISCIKDAAVDYYNVVRRQS